VISWLKKIDLTTVALILGPILMIVGLFAFRHQLWGPTLRELSVLVRKHDVDLQGIEQRQNEMLRRQQQILEELRSRGAR
jgi:uncharacterized protein YoxC